MNASRDAEALERFLRPMARELSSELARAIVNLVADEETQKRYEALADKRNTGEITQAELEELESFLAFLRPKRKPCLPKRLMDAALGQLVRQRAGHRCEYCWLPQRFSGLRFHVEHIIARQHRGGDEFDKSGAGLPGMQSSQRNQSHRH